MTPVFICEDGEAIRGIFKCDGWPDCTDATDEMVCERSVNDQLFVCDDGDAIRKEYKCDKYYDCADRSDETPELCG